MVDRLRLRACLLALALIRLDEAYSQFPEGFIEDINGTGEPLEINIVKEINSTGAENTISNAGGLFGLAGADRLGEAHR